MSDVGEDFRVALVAARANLSRALMRAEIAESGWVTAVRQLGGVAVDRDEALVALASRETYTEEGGRIVVRQLQEVRAERDALAARLAAVEALADKWRNDEMPDPTSAWEDLREALS